MIFKKTRPFDTEKDSIGMISNGHIVLPDIRPLIDWMITRRLELEKEVKKEYR